MTELEQIVDLKRRLAMVVAANALMSASVEAVLIHVRRGGHLNAQGVVKHQICLYEANRLMTQALDCTVEEIT